MRCDSHLFTCHRQRQQTRRLFGAWESAATDIACASLGTDYMAHSSVRTLDDVDAHAAQDHLPDHESQLGR